MARPKYLETVDAERERIILGALLLDGAPALESCLRLKPDMFGIIEYQLLFRRITDHLAEHDAIDGFVLEDILRRNGELSKIYGGAATLFDLTTGVPRRAMLDQHVAEIVERWKCRRAVGVFEAGMSAIAARESADDVLARAQSAAMDITAELGNEDDPRVLAMTLPELEAWRSADQGEAIARYGLPVLDRHTGGMYPGEVTVLGGRNGVGKTAALITMVVANSRAGIPCDVFSLEMTKGQLLRRIWAMEANVHQRVLRRRNEATADDVKAVSAAAMRVAEWPLRIFDKSSLDVRQITAHARVGVRKYGVRVVAVDYAQRVNAEGKDERLRTKAVSETLTAFAKDTGAHVLLLSQLRKVPIEQYSKAPSLADLRETGQLGDDAHVVLLYHRAYDEESGGLKLDGEVYIPKQRSGETLAIPVHFDARSGRFVDAARLERAA